MSPVKPMSRPMFIPADLPAGELPQLAIRVANLTDFDALYTLAEAAAHSACAGDYTPVQVQTLLRCGLRVDVQLIRDRTCYVIEHARRVVACGAWSHRAAWMGRIHPDDTGSPRDLLDPEVHPARLRAFFVHPEFARRGMGRVLVALCERLASAARFRELELLATPAGRRLFLACGFRDVEPMTQIFPNGVAVCTYRMVNAIEPAAGDHAWSREHVHRN